MKTSGSQFLHERNADLHASPEVEMTVDYLNADIRARNAQQPDPEQRERLIPNEPVQKISAYMGFLANKEYANDGILTGDPAGAERQIEAACVALTPENAQAYVKFQAKVARELGRGAEIDPDNMDDAHKMEALRLVRRDQLKQLNDWVGELNSDENNYPGWFKYWMLENVKRHTAFNDDLDRRGRPKGFERRSDSSFTLFPELDRESVSLVYDALVEKLGGQPMGFEYDGMRALLAKANFGELYGEAQNYGFKITDSLKAVTTGSWHDFTQSDKRTDAVALPNLVRSYRTGWCTAGSETAAVQLSAGDFYVWCSTNPQTGKDEVPRIAVRMEQGTVAEVRGVIGGRRQELEPQLADVVMEKIKDLPGGASYFRKAEHMKRLTAIEKQIKAQPDYELSDTELRFLYELDHDIEGFGYDRDPRIAEIRTARGERDKPELMRVLPEAIRGQVRSAFAAYETVSEQLTGGRQGLFRRKETTMLSPNEFERLFAAKDREWQENGIYDYVIEQLITNGARFNLVATPNVEASEQQIVALAETFGKEQPYSTYVYDALYRRGQYTDREWSGVTGNAPVRLSLIPSRLDQELSYRPTDEQVRLLHERQARRPRLGLHVPSLLDAVTYWYSLRAGGDKLDDSSAFDKTYIRHFDLEPRVSGGVPVVPVSFVNNDGWPAWTTRMPSSTSGLGSRWGKFFDFRPSFYSFSFV